MLAMLVERQQAREWYSVEQFARLVGRSDFTVREWARKGRILAAKKGSGRGAHQAWAISQDELLQMIVNVGRLFDAPSSRSPPCMKQFVALAPVSSREQEREGFSLEVQEDGLKRYAAQAAGEIVKLFKIAETASKCE